MRFFSNDARESADDQPDEQAAARQGHDEQAGRVQSQPVAVPQQRPPSPWSNTPPAAGEPVVADPDRDGVPERDSAANGVGADTDVPPGDGVVTSSTTYARGTVTPPDTVPAIWAGPDDHGSDPVVDLPLDDSTDRDAVQDDAIASDDVIDRNADRDRNRDDAVTTFDDADRTKDDTDRAKTAALEDGGGFDDPRAVDPVTDTPLDSGDSSTDRTPPAVVAVPVAAPATTTATSPAGSDTLFDPDDARTLQERWREVQLRFVDSPKDSAGDAAKLVDEAVEKLSTRLRMQRAGLTNDTDDTEQLRVQLRAYRDILNRILSL